MSISEDWIAAACERLQAKRDEAAAVESQRIKRLEEEATADIRERAYNLFGEEFAADATYGSGIIGRNIVGVATLSYQGAKYYLSCSAKSGAPVWTVASKDKDRQITVPQGPINGETTARILEAVADLVLGGGPTGDKLTIV